MDQQRQFGTREAHAMNAPHVARQDDVPIVSHPHERALRLTGFVAAGPQVQQVNEFTPHSLKNLLSWCT